MTAMTTQPDAPRTDARCPVATSRCERPAGHDGEHYTTFSKGDLWGWTVAEAATPADSLDALRDAVEDIASRIEGRVRDSSTPPFGTMLSWAQTLRAALRAGESRSESSKPLHVHDEAVLRDTAQNDPDPDEREWAESLLAGSSKPEEVECDCGVAGSGWEDPHYAGCASLAGSSKPEVEKP